MDYQKTLPTTGLGALVAGGVLTNQLWLPVVALGVVAVTAIVIRLVFRRRKRATDA